MAKRRNAAKWTVRVTRRSGAGSWASIFRNGVWKEEVGPIADFRYEWGGNRKKNDLAAIHAARDRIIDLKQLDRENPAQVWKTGKWIKASAVRVRKVAGRVVMDIKKAI